MHNQCGLTDNNTVSSSSCVGRFFPYEPCLCCRALFVHSGSLKHSGSHCKSAIHQSWLKYNLNTVVLFEIKYPVRIFSLVQRQTVCNDIRGVKLIILNEFQYLSTIKFSDEGRCRLLSTSNKIIFALVAHTSLIKEIG